MSHTWSESQDFRVHADGTEIAVVHLPVASVAHIVTEREVLVEVEPMFGFERVRFEYVTVHGKQMRSASELRMLTEKARDVEFL